MARLLGRRDAAQDAEENDDLQRQRDNFLHGVERTVHGFERRAQHPPHFAGQRRTVLARDFRRRLSEGLRKLTGRRHVVHYFHQVDDPYSHLAAQMLEPLIGRESGRTRVLVTHDVEGGLDAWLVWSGFFSRGNLHDAPSGRAGRGRARLRPARLRAAPRGGVPAPRAASELAFFRVRRVEIVGTQYIPPSDILRRLNVDTTHSVWDPAAPLEERLSHHPEIRAARVRRRLPGTLVVEIVESLPVALVPTASGLRAYDDRGMLLPVSAPFHCALMKPAEERLAPDLRALAAADPAIPVVANVDAEPKRDAASAVDALNTAAYEKWADVCTNGYAIVSRENGSNGQDLYEGTVTAGDPSSAPATCTGSGASATVGGCGGMVMSSPHAARPPKANMLTNSKDRETLCILPPDRGA